MSAQISHVINSEQEVWAVVVGFPDYQVSSLGRIKSFRPVNGVCKPRWRLLKGSIRKASGYVFVGLTLGGRTHHRQVHRLVLETFVGPCPSGMETRHRNGVRHDNRLANVCWGTPKENATDRAAHGTHLRGEASPNAKLTEAKVLELRRLRRVGMSWRKLAAATGVSEATVRFACFHNWSHVAG